jgi:DNA ligase D-like protein (predicted ligase)
VQLELKLHINDQMAEDKALDRLPSDARTKLRRANQPDWIAPMLATLTEERFSREGWLFEPKLDGERCLVFRNAPRLEMYSRNRKLLNSKYPEIVEAFERQKAKSYIVDGEIVAFENGVTNFAKLQQRMQIQDPSAELRKRIPVCFYAFDLLFLGAFDLRQLPLRYRKSLLEKTFEFEEPLRYTEHRDAHGEAYYREACKRHWEGIIAKDGNSAYVSERSRQWLKFKCMNEQEFVVTGYTDPQGRRIGFGALLVGYYERGELKYAGKVGTGYDNETLRRLGKQLASLETCAKPCEGNSLPRSGIHWVKPALIAQIGFTEWTGDGKLRHPRFLGLRDDKEPKEVTREK